jgi:hypothetical protein
LKHCSISQWNASKAGTGSVSATRPKPDPLLHLYAKLIDNYRYHLYLSLFFTLASFA